MTFGGGRVMVNGCGSSGPRGRRREIAALLPPAVDRPLHRLRVVRLGQFVCRREKRRARWSSSSSVAPFGHFMPLVATQKTPALLCRGRTRSSHVPWYHLAADRLPRDTGKYTSLALRGSGRTRRRYDARRRFPSPLIFGRLRHAPCGGGSHRSPLAERRRPRLLLPITMQYSGYEAGGQRFFARGT